jgi:glycosyltransferase involved in cell wall biosynthesis
VLPLAERWQLSRPRAGWRTRQASGRVRILLVSQMYPGADAPDLGAFVQALERALAERGHELERAVLDRRSGGRLRYLELARTARSAARRFRPDVVYAHFLVPSGLAAALASDAPLVVTAHGQDVRNVGSLPGVRSTTRYVVRRAAAVVAVSDYLRRELEAKVPEARGKTEVVDSGVDLERFAVSPAPEGETAYLCVGRLEPRKNVVRVADAFARVGEGTLTFVGDGPLRQRLEGRPGVRVSGPVPHAAVPDVLAGAHVVCQPSLVEPFGQTLLEAMACGRSVVATRVGGPPEFVPPEAGVLVDPTDEEALAEALRAAARLPRPNLAARAAAERHDVRLQAERIEAILERAARDRRAGSRREA